MRDCIVAVWTFSLAINNGFYDALIIAAALEAGCTRLRSEGLSHGHTIEGLTIENPFPATA